MKRSALNVDFSSSSPDSSGLRRPPDAGVKEGYPYKRSLFYCCWLIERALADRHRLVAYRNNNC